MNEIVIKSHNFELAKNRLGTFSNKDNSELAIDRVKTDGGLFGLGNHKVTGEEFNYRIETIQKYLIDIYSINNENNKEFREVYKAFEALDKDYIACINASFEAINKTQNDVIKQQGKLGEHNERLQEQQSKLNSHQDEIDKIIKNIKNDLVVLKSFKEKLDSFKALLEKVQSDISVMLEFQSDCSEQLDSLHKYRDFLSNLKHIKDVDKLWEYSVSAAENIKNIVESVKKQSKTISGFDYALHSSQQEQQKFIAEVNHSVSKFRADFNNQIKKLNDLQTISLNKIKNTHDRAIEQLTVKQKEKISEIEKTQKERYDLLIKEQSLFLSNIEKKQEENFKQLSDNQSAVFEQITHKQSSELNKIFKFLEEEKSLHNEQIATFTKKLKFSYIVAGGAMALAIVQLLLNIFGVV